MEQAHWRRIANELMTQIDRGLMREGDRLPPEVDLAAQYGVSRQTIHRAVSELKRLGHVVRQRRTGTVIAPPVGSRTKNVALILDYAYDFPQTDLVRGIQSVLGESHRLLLCDTGNNPSREAEHLEKMRQEADGILIYPLSQEENTPLLQQLADAGMPLVCLDRIPRHLHADGVVSDNFDVSRRGVEMLVRRGHEMIAFFSGDNSNVSTVEERHRAYVEVMQEAGRYEAAVERWFAKELEQKPNRLIQSASDALFALGNRPNPPTALFCVQDCYAMAAIEAMEQNPRLPRVEILTFNDWPAMMLRRPSELHRIVQKPFEIGREAAERLSLRMSGLHPETQTLVVAADLHEAPLTHPHRPSSHEATATSDHQRR